MDMTLTKRLWKGLLPVQLTFKNYSERINKRVNENDPQQETLGEVKLTLSNTNKSKRIDKKS